jgi:hypothetical protein
LVAAGEIVDERKLIRTRKKRERERERERERKQTLHALLRKCYLEALGPRDP